MGILETEIEPMSSAQSVYIKFKKVVIMGFFQGFTIFINSISDTFIDFF